MVGKITGTLIPLESLSRKQLEEAAVTAENVRRVKKVAEIAKMTNGELIQYIESLVPPVKVPFVPPRMAQKPRMRNRGVGRYCRELLLTVAAQTAAGPEGLAYDEMVKRVQKKFPDSMADERHLRWYATQMRAEGVMLPDQRRRSKWTK